jgi:transglutaminase-like putative cysteine protease
MVFHMMAMLGVMALGGQSEPAKPTGAAIVFTSGDPVMVRVRVLLAEGKLAEAEQTLQSERNGDSQDRRQVAEDGLEIIRRLRREYRLDLPALLERLRKSIPDVTAEDVLKWQDAGEVQFRLLDGRPCYFASEPTNVFRFCEEAKRRRVPDGSDKQARANEELNKHLEAVIKAADSSGKPEVLPVRHRIHYKITVTPNRPGVKAGSTVRCWLPFPQDYRQQKQVKLIRTSPSEHKIAPGVIDGCTLAGAAQRTLYMEQRIEDPAQPVAFEEELEYVSYAYCPKLEDSAARPLPGDWGNAYLEERPPHIVFSRDLRDAVEQAVGDETNPLARARRIFHYVVTTMKYRIEEEYTVIPSFTAKALTTHKGDCGIHSMLFISMCRAAGIPARWQSGWESQPLNWNMHDWAEFYVEPWGWLPADTSYGLKKSDDARVREFYFGHLDSWRMIVNLDYGCPLDPPKHGLRSEPADFQRGEVEIDGRNLYFDEWDWNFGVDLEPIAN